MLPRKNLLLNFVIFRFFSALNYLPLSLESITGKICLRHSTIRLFLWRLQFFVSSVHVTYLNLRLVQSALDTRYFVLLHFPIHFIQCFLFTLGSYYAHYMFIRCPSHTVALFNEIHSFEIGSKNF